MCAQLNLGVIFLLIFVVVYGTGTTFFEGDTIDELVRPF